MVAVILALINPFTDCENVAVTGIVAAFVLEALVEVSTTVGPPDAADESDANPPNTAIAVMTLTAAAERNPICFDFILLIRLILISSFSEPIALVKQSDSERRVKKIFDNFILALATGFTMRIMKKSQRTVAIVIIICGVCVFALVLAQAVWGENSGIVPPTEQQEVNVASAVATTSLPARLLIPTLGINANVQYVGTNKAGDVGVPSNFVDVAWYKNGVVPGSPGSAVIDGHVDNGLSLPGVFKRLTDIRVGDSLYIETKGGSELHFVVYDIEVYTYKNVPMRKVFASGDVAHVNLITCEGVWVTSGKTYDHRIVVYTALVS